MNFGGIPPGTSRIQGPAELGLPHLLHAWLPQGCRLRLGMSHAARGQGRDAGRGSHDEELLQTDAEHEACFQPSAVTYVAKGNL